MMRPRWALMGLIALTGLRLGGCEAASLFGGMAQNFEYSKQIEVLSKYDGLENQTVAVLVQCDMATMYEHPDLELSIATGVALRIQKEVPGVKVVDPRRVHTWKFRTPQWSSMSFGEMADRLDVDRLVHVDLYEYRLHPPGNRFLWDGVCAANVGIIERGGYDPDTFVDSFNVENRFPDLEGVGQDNASREQIRTGLLGPFVQRTAWLFHTHLEPKYPDKYKPPPP